MKVLIAGNCQGNSIASCLKAMNPGLDVSFALSTGIEDGTFNIADAIQSADVVLAHRFLRHRLAEFDAGNVTYIPSIVFPAYHPDMCYLRGIRKGGALETVTSEMIVYHSPIVVFCYVNGRSVSETVSWFNAHTYSRLGYIDAWQSARADLMEEGQETGIPLGALINKWARGGPFMYSMNHPKLRAIADVTRAVMTKLDLPILHRCIEDVVDDPLKNMSIWPVYPELAERLGVEGDLIFRRPDANYYLTLTEFVEKSFAQYDNFERSSLQMSGMSLAEMSERIATPSGFAVQQPGAKRNPYAGARPIQFWRNSVAEVEMAAVDPVVDPGFAIAKNDKIATAGSCFAQHIARTLAKSGFNYYTPENSPAGMSTEAAKNSNYGVYSARYGNIYTVRQLLQLIERVEGRFKPHHDVWARHDGRLVDPFRPQIEPDGFADLESLQASRDIHLHAVSEMLREMDVFVFTLGLTEGWRSKFDGAVYPLAPGVAGGLPDMDVYEFHNFTVDEITTDLDKVLDLIKLINPTCRVVLTVSPVPLVATYEPRHALVATTYSKSVLRTAADHAARNWDHVEYFPSYEIITGSFNRGAYFEEDLREVKPEGVAHVMGVFMRHYTTSGEATSVAPAKVRSAEKKSLFDIVCDEEAILNF